MEVRLATIEDIDAITAVINGAFRKAESFFIDGDRIEAESVRVLMEGGEFVVAEDEGAIRGCVYVQSRGERAYLGLLAVDPSVQKAGIGSQLMTAGEERCAKSGCRCIDLRIVNLRTEMHAFYSRRGYAQTGTEPFPGHLTPKIRCHFVNMSKPLT